MQYGILLTIYILLVFRGIGAPVSLTLAGEAEVERDALNIQHRVERLERSRELARHTETSIQRHLGITVSGLFEVEMRHADDQHATDLTLAALELGFDLQPTFWVNGHLLFLFEEKETEPPEIDEAIVTLANPRVLPFSLAVGRMHVPFGHFASALISDPLTLALGETRKTAMQIGYVARGFHALGYLFDAEAGGGVADRSGMKIGYHRDGSESASGYDLGVSWIGDLAATDSLRDVLGDSPRRGDVVAGWSVHATLRWRHFTLVGEYLGAVASFGAADLDFRGIGARPAAWNLEIERTFEYQGRPLSMAMAWQRTRAASALELPKTRWLVGLSLSLHEHATLAFEYSHDEAYAFGVGGSGANRNAFGVQLALSF